MVSFIEIDPAMVDRFLDVAVRGDVDEVIEMIDGGVPANTRDESGTTALHLASLNNHKDLVLVLLQKGADVNKQTDGGVTPLHWAAWTNSTDVISVLLQQGALVNISDNFGSTALDEARRWNNEEAVHLLKQINYALLKGAVVHVLTFLRCIHRTVLCVFKNLRIQYIL